MFFGKVRTITCCITLVLLFLKAYGLLKTLHVISPLISADNKHTYSMHLVETLYIYINYCLAFNLLIG